MTSLDGLYLPRLEYLCEVLRVVHAINNTLTDVQVTKRLDFFSVRRTPLNSFIVNDETFGAIRALVGGNVSEAGRGVSILGNISATKAYRETCAKAKGVLTPMYTSSVNSVNLCVRKVVGEESPSAKDDAIQLSLLAVVGALVGLGIVAAVVYVQWLHVSNTAVDAMPAKDEWECRF
ncbi:Aste57867_12314 [Aphanomyces stellatus]|uniref:Aste57867_12314 protein n=1 Tax=Aphanomyces stellatus TaxID=120398 RepID=A0A485KVV0_9STRA|nr:hypothetical protein As57867_012268 [Aphanomyces stellatus]VFT89166.1 Aste57867_12314 [Aphanomyces stellatus]